MNFHCRFCCLYRNVAQYRSSSPFQCKQQPVAYPLIQGFVHQKCSKRKKFQHANAAFMSSFHTCSAPDTISRQRIRGESFSIRQPNSTEQAMHRQSRDFLANPQDVSYGRKPVHGDGEDGVLVFTKKFKRGLCGLYSFCPWGGE